jgi:hypothetical protein
LLQLLHVDKLEPAHAAHALALPDAARVLTDYLNEVSGLNTSRIIVRMICVFTAPFLAFRIRIESGFIWISGFREKMSPKGERKNWDALKSSVFFLVSWRRFMELGTAW